MKRLEPTDRKTQILQSALHASRVHGYSRVTRDQVAAAAGCSPGLVSHYFSTMEKLRKQVMASAVRLKDPVLVAQGLSAQDSTACNAPDALRRSAIAHLSK